MGNREKEVRGTQGKKRKNLGKGYSSGLHLVLSLLSPGLRKEGKAVRIRTLSSSTFAFFVPLFLLSLSPSL